MKNVYTLLIAIVLMISTSCEDFVSIDMPNSRLTTTSVFASDKTATAAALSMYESMLQVPSFSASGSVNSIATIGGVYSDEFSNYLLDNEVFAENNVEASNAAVRSIWSSAYYTIF